MKMKIFLWNYQQEVQRIIAGIIEVKDRWKKQEKN